MQSYPSGEPPEVRPGLVLGRYELLSPIAAGGMAQVWAARMKGARQFQKIVAVKTMLPKLSEDAQFEQMFLDEASLASQIRHPNAVEIMDLGEQHGILYLVMEWIEGVPLNQLMKTAKKNGGIPVAVAARIAYQACAGLHAAHELKDDKGQSVGLVHRDVSPQNLLVTYDGVTKVVDFGVAKATALGGGATQAGQVKGKVSYMAPEQVNGEGLDRRADVFALGIVLYALTTGKHPFRRESEAATMYNICSAEAVVPPRSVVDGYAPELEKVVLKSLEKNRDNRYASCDEMLRALDALPSHLRVSSDSDVAEFVRGLLDDKRIEQKRRIDDAIAHADANPNQTFPGNPMGSMDMQSQTGRVTMNTLTGTQELSGVATGMHPQTMRNRVIGAAGLIALAVSGGVLATTIMNQGAGEPREIRVIEAPEPPPVAAKSNPEEETKAEAPSGEDAIDMDSLPEEEPVPDETSDAKTVPTTEVTTKTAAAKSAPVRAPKPKPKAQPKAAPKPAGSWKFDAGF